MMIPNKPEPSVLDYLKGKLFPRRNPPVEIPETPSISEENLNGLEHMPVIGKTRGGNRRFFWLLILIIVLSVIGQKFMEPPNRSVSIGLVFYSCAIILVV